MDNSKIIERLNYIISLLKEDDRERADSELYSLFDELEFISEDFDSDDDYEDEDDEDYDDEN